MGIYKDIQDIFAPARNRLHASPDPDAQIIDGKKSAFLVGLAAFLLPIAMGVSTLWGTCFYDTISHFYYARFAGGIFIGLVFFIGTFLIAYKGESTAEGIFAGAAGLCAFGTALFPTTGSGCETGPFPARVFANVTQIDEAIIVTPHGDGVASYFDLLPLSGALHNGFAGILFVFLAFYCFVIFPRVKSDQLVPGTDQLTGVKLRRNRLYFLSGSTIAAALIALFFRTIFGEDWFWWEKANLTFWLESLALFAFGLSWMVKGRFFGYALADASERPDANDP